MFVSNAVVGAAAEMLWVKAENNTDNHGKGHNLGCVFIIYYAMVKI